MPANAGHRKAAFRAALLTAMLLAAHAGPVRAQLEFGLNVGPSFTNLSGSFIESSKTTSGIYVGAVLEYRLNRNWALESGFTSMQKGAFHVRTAGSTGEWDYKSSYLQVPLRVRYVIPFADDKWDFGPYIGAGFSFGGSCKVRASPDGPFDDECGSEATAAPGGTMNSSDFMYGFGIVVDRVFAQSGFGLDVRYALGTSSVFSSEATGGLTAKNRTFDIKIRLVFPSFGSW